MPRGSGCSDGSRITGSTAIVALTLLWQDSDAWVETLCLKIHHTDAQVSKSWVTEENQNNQQTNQAAKIKVSWVDLDWQHKCELFLTQWAHDTVDHEKGM